MNRIDKKTSKIFAFASIGLMILVELLGSLEALSFLGRTNHLFVPLLFVAAVIGLYLSFREDVLLPGKWTWLPIAILLTHAMSSLADAIYSVKYLKQGLPVSHYVASILGVIGFSLIVVALLEKRLKILFPIGFGVLALQAIMWETPLSLLAYGSMIALFFVKDTKANVFVRYAALILAFLAGNWVITVALITLAVLLVPFSKSEFSLARIAALACVLFAVLFGVRFVTSEPFDEVEYYAEEIANAKEEIADAEAVIVAQTEVIDTAKKAIDGYTQKKQTHADKAAELRSALTAQKSKLNSLNRDLDKYCTRSSYSSWYCWYYNDDECKSYHAAVTDQEKVVSKTEKSISDEEDSIATLNSQIRNAENKISDAEYRINTSKATITAMQTLLPKLKNAKFGALLMALLHCATVLTAFAAFVCFAVCLWRNALGKFAILSFAVLSFCSIASIFLAENSAAGWNFDIFGYPIPAFLMLPDFWAGVLFTLFAVILCKKEGKVTGYRIAAVVVALLTGATGAVASVSLIVVYAVLAVLMICIAFLLVPVHMTDYNNVAKHIFWSFVTLGIWNLLWVYHMTKTLNDVEGVPARKPAAELLLCLLLPFYGIYWLYKTADDVAVYAKVKGKAYDVSVITLVFACICPIFATILIQDKMNLIVGKPE